MAGKYMSDGADEAAKIKADRKKLKAEQKAQRKEAKRRKLTKSFCINFRF